MCISPWPCPDQPGFLCTVKTPWVKKKKQNTMSHMKLRNVCFCSKNNMDYFKLMWETDALWWEYPADAYLFAFSCGIWTLCRMLETDCIFGITQHFQLSFCGRIWNTKKNLHGSSIYTTYENKVHLIEIEGQGIYLLTNLRVPEAPLWTLRVLLSNIWNF